MSNNTNKYILYLKTISNKDFHINKEFERCII